MPPKPTPSREIAAAALKAADRQIARLRDYLHDKKTACSAIDFTLRENTIAEYRQYRMQPADRIPVSADSLVVLPEGLSEWLPFFQDNPVLVWWLSVDNGLNGLSRVNLNYLRRPNVFHATQSAYAARFIESLGLRNIGDLSDYTAELFKAPISADSRPKQVALNKSSKVIANLDRLTHLIGTARPDIQVVRIGGMSREKVIETFQQSRIFVDLGTFPGKDRLAREAALIGCAVIVADAGAGHTTQDFPLAEEDHIDPWDLERVAVRVIQLIDSPELADENSRSLRVHVQAEKARFAEEVLSVFTQLEILAKQIQVPDQSPGNRPLLRVKPKKRWRLFSRKK